MFQVQLEVQEIGPKEFWESILGGFPELAGGSYLRVPILRIRILQGLCWRPANFGKLLLGGRGIAFRLNPVQT